MRERRNEKTVQQQQQHHHQGIAYCRRELSATEHVPNRKTFNTRKLCDVKKNRIERRKKLVHVVFLFPLKNMCSACVCIRFGIIGSQQC